MNKAIVVGNLGQTPELKSTNSGTNVCNLSVATSYKKGDEEQVEWHRVVVFGKQAESCAKFLEKGRSVYIEGRLQTRSYEKDGEKRYSTEIVADTVQFLGGKGERSADTGSADEGDSENDIPF